MDVRQGSKYACAPPHIFSDPGDHLDQGDIMFRKGEEEEIFDSHGDTGKMKDAIRYQNRRWSTIIIPYEIDSILKQCKYVT